jgi:hypothetical protein
LAFDVLELVASISVAKPTLHEKKAAEAAEAAKERW